MTAKLTVYRRDYCGYCMRLVRALHKWDRLTEHGGEGGQA